MFSIRQVVKGTKTRNLYFMAIMVFVVSFAIQLYFNTFVIIARSLPDEMGAIYLASFLAGNDWSYVMTHPAQYYGSMSAFIMYPFFRLVHDPLVLYQCLLGVGAFLRSIPAVICFFISYKYLHINNLKISFCLSLSASLFTPTRATNIDNEPGLILCCWLLVLLIMTLAHTVQKVKKVYLSILLSFVLCISLLSHTRAIVYTISTICVIIFFHFLTRKALVNYFGFLSSFITFYIASKVISSYWTKTLYPVEDTVAIGNTAVSLSSTISDGLAKLLGEYGLQSFLDLFASNLLVIFVFSGGIVIFCLWLFCLQLLDCTRNRILIQRETEETSLLFPLMFCIVGSGIGIVGLCVTWIDSALNQHLYNDNLTRGHFYLRYYSMFFGPLLMIVIGYWFSQDEIKKAVNKKVKQLFLLTILTLEVCTCYSWISFLETVTNEYSQSNSDWFYYFAPLSMEFVSYPNSSQSAGYYFISIKAALVLFSIFYLFYKYKKRLGMILYTLSFLLYQYCYLVVFWDRPFCYGPNYYQSVNATYELIKVHPGLFNEVDEISYLNPQYGPQYLVQFVLSDTRIVLENPSNRENTIILASSLDYVLTQNISSDDYWYILLDDNEYLLVKGEVYLSLFSDENIELISLAEYH